MLLKFSLFGELFIPNNSYSKCELQAGQEGLSKIAQTAMDSLPLPAVCLVFLIKYALCQRTSIPFYARMGHCGPNTLYVVGMGYFTSFMVQKAHLQWKEIHGESPASGHHMSSLAEYQGDDTQQA